MKIYRYFFIFLFGFLISCTEPPSNKPVPPSEDGSNGSKATNSGNSQVSTQSHDSNLKIELKEVFAEVSKNSFWNQQNITDKKRIVHRSLIVIEYCKTHNITSCDSEHLKNTILELDQM